jgi:hypothetical protein
VTSKSAVCLLGTSWLAATWSGIALAAAPAEIDAATPVAAAPEEAVAEEAAGGVNLDLGFATHYVFRGLNLFADDAQLDPHMLLAPGATWAVADTGLAVGWWAAFQLNGNVRDNIEAGYGAEQDLFATYDFALTDTVSLGLQMYAYLYPFADEAVAGTDGLPTWLEPGASIGWAGPVELRLTFTYMAGVQAALASGSYVYLSPSLGRSFDLAETLSLDLAASLGFKAWTRAEEKLGDNTFDVGAKVGLTWSATDVFYVAPAVGFAWTNLAGLGFADEYIVFGALNVGVDI